MSTPMRSRLARTVATLALCAVAAPRSTHADGVAQVMTAKSLPPATVQVIDPESGTSSGGGTTDVRIGPGDIVIFRFKYFPVPDKIVRGLQGYLTEYIPANTEVVGVRLTDANGVTIEPRFPGIAVNGCAGPCNGFNAVPGFTTTDRNLDDGSISQVYADTGVFYTTDARLARNPATAFLSLVLGILMNPEPRDANSIKSILGTSSPIYVHNAWDWIQTRAFGISTAYAENSGDGNTPFRYGSPVAGPDTHYVYEATEVTGLGGGEEPIRFRDVVGPWQRVRSPGAQIGSGTAVTGGGTLQRMNVDTNLGVDLTPNAPLPNTLSGDATTTRAIRIALGEVRVGEPGFAEVALRVLGTPLDLVQNADVNCGEVFGGDTSAASASVRGRDNPWSVHLASPNCVFLNLLFDLTVDKNLAITGDVLTYTLHGKNLSINTQTGGIARQKFDSTRVSFLSATGGGTVVANCEGDGLACVVWNLGTLDPGEEYTFTTQFSVGGGGHVTNVMQARYVSTQLPGGFGTQALTIVRQVAVLNATLASNTTVATAGSTAAFAGTIANTGSGDSNMDTLTIVLPTGWTVNGSVLVGGVALTGCSGTNVRTCNLGGAFAAGETRTLTFTTNVPAGTATGLYDVDLQIWGSQSAFGGSYETYFNDVATQAVGQARSTPPVLTCPIVNGAATIAGTTVEATGTTIRLYFNLQARASGTSIAGGTWSITGFLATFGELYGGLEVRATAQATGELESVLSEPCTVTTVPRCVDGLDNDGDGLTDFPADPGCANPLDNNEVDDVFECSDGSDNDLDGAIDYGADLSCSSSIDPTEGGGAACADGADNDGDGLTDLLDPGCVSATDADEVEHRACDDGLDNDGDGDVDLGADPGCHSANDDDETDLVSTTDVKARLLIAFDTSGSMNKNVCLDDANPLGWTGGDGSVECPGADVACGTCTSPGCGDGVANDSRLDKVKDGISDVISAFGEVDYGLMRFHQREGTFACPTQNASLASGGWQGGGAAPCPGGFAAGDLLVGFSPDNPYDLLEWMNGQDDYQGTPPPGLDIELRGSGTTPLAGILSSSLTALTDVRAGDAIATCRPYRVVLVTDGAESCNGNAPAAAAALLAAGIPVHVIGFATNNPAITTNLNAIAAAGGTGTAIVVDDSTELSLAMASIVTDTLLVELCNGADDDCDGLADEDFTDLGALCDNGQRGTCYLEGTRECDGSGFGTRCNAPTGVPTTETCNNVDDDCDGLVDEGIPGGCLPCFEATEVCNGRDDDCDGQTDEGTLPGEGDSCGSDVGRCDPGVLDCVGGSMDCVGDAGPFDEICNSLDDDCDNVTDAFSTECYGFPVGCSLATGMCLGECRIGLDTCNAGAATGCVGQVGPIAELCNGLDDDCDGEVDELWPDLGVACDNDLVGACRTTGVVACLPDGSDATCTAPPVGVGTEFCNGLDDDCDGEVDEGVLPAPVGNACGGGAGCTPGTLQCVSGEIECVGAGGGVAEICNGQDDDCDGFTDEPTLPPPVGDACFPAELDPFCDDAGVCVGICRPGANICEGGGLTCDGFVGPQPEVCNGLDDDCDGVDDETATCEDAEQACVGGGCLAPCELGEFPCAFGFLCESFPTGRFCAPDPCARVECDDGFRCGQITGACEDLCEPSPCQEGEECTRLPDSYVCQDCFQLGCPTDQVCVAGATGVGACEADPCADVDCEDGQFCRDGACIATTCEPACEGDLVCLDGTCVESLCSDDACEDTRCDPGFTCHPATSLCAPDPCSTTTCDPGTECLSICAPDGDDADMIPDLRSTCAPPDAPPAEHITALGGGGCACEVAPRRTSAGAGWLAVLGLVIVLGSRAGGRRARGRGAR